jgi:hypothetical protein
MTMLEGAPFTGRTGGFSIRPGQHFFKELGSYSSYWKKFQGLTRTGFFSFSCNNISTKVDKIAISALP